MRNELTKTKIIPYLKVGIFALPLFLFVVDIAFANPIVSSNMTKPPIIMCDPGPCSSTPVPWFIDLFETNPLLFAIIFHIIVDSLVFVAVSLIVKAWKSFKSSAITIPVLVVISFLAYYLRFTVANKYDGALFIYLLPAVLIFIGDFLATKYINKSTNEQAAIVGFCMAILTHPILWAYIFILLNITI